MPVHKRWLHQFSTTGRGLHAQPVIRKFMAPVAPEGLQCLTRRSRKPVPCRYLVYIGALRKCAGITLNFPLLVVRHCAPAPILCLAFLLQQSNDGRERLFLNALTQLLTCHWNIAMQLLATKSCAPRSLWGDGDSRKCRGKKAGGGRGEMGRS